MFASEHHMESKDRISAGGLEGPSLVPRNKGSFDSDDRSASGSMIFAQDDKFRAADENFAQDDNVGWVNEEFAQDHKVYS